MTVGVHLMQKRLLLLIRRGAWPYYVAIVGLVLVFWLYHSLQ